MCDIFQLASEIKKQNNSKGNIGKALFVVKNDTENLLDRSNDIGYKMLKIIDYIKDNENKLSLDIIYQDLENDFTKIISFIEKNEKIINGGSIYIKYFSTCMENIKKLEIVNLEDIYINFNKNVGNTEEVEKKDFYYNMKKSIIVFTNNLDKDIKTQKTA